MGKRVTIIGDGGWGTALAMVLVKNGHDVTVWGPFPEYITEITVTSENRTYLPGVALPPEILWTADRAEAVSEAEVVVLASPTRFFRSVADSFADSIAPGVSVVSVAKGLDENTHERMTQVAASVLGRSCVAALSGPSHAEEVSRGIPTAVVIASRDASQSEELQDLFASPLFRVYTSADTIGVELGGALKNVIAIAVGLSDGLGFGDNTRAALITRGLAEIARLGCAMGAEPATFSGLSGMGDLIVTCTSRYSRNRAVGERLGKGESIGQILDGMKQVAEGVWNCASARALAREHGVEAPISEEVCAIIHDGKEPSEAVGTLLGRDFKPE